MRYILNFYELSPCIQSNHRVSALPVLKKIKLNVRQPVSIPRVKPNMHFPVEVLCPEFEMKETVVHQERLVSPAAPINFDDMYKRLMSKKRLKDQEDLNKEQQRQLELAAVQFETTRVDNSLVSQLRGIKSDYD